MPRIKKELDRNDGTKLKIYALDAGDTFTVVDQTVTEKDSQFGKMYSVNVRFSDGVVGFVGLTKKQGETLAKVQGLQGKQFTCYKYDTKFRANCIGVKAVPSTSPGV